MNTVTAKFSGSTWAGLAALAAGGVLMFVCLFSVVMLVCHPSMKPGASVGQCKCPDTTWLNNRRPNITVPYTPRYSDFKDASAESNPVNTSATSELKQQGGCPTCPNQRVVRNPVIRYPSQPVYNPQPTYTYPSQPTYVYPSQPQPVYTPQPQPVRTPVVTTPTNATPVSVSDKCQLALFLDSSRESALLKNWFETDPSLLALRNKCVFSVYTPENALYRSRYANIVPVKQFPVVLFQYPSGGHIHAAGQDTIPKTAAELYSDLKLGYEKAQSVKNAPVTSSGSEIMTRGYNFDVVQQTNEDCPDGNCPINNEDDNRWRPGDRIRDMFPAAKDARQIVVWGGTLEIVVYVAVVVTVVMAAVTFAVVLLVVVLKMVRNQQ